MVMQFRWGKQMLCVNSAVRFLAFYWTASVSYWRYSRSLHKKENVISPDPGLPLGWEGITDPCFTKYSLRVCSSVLNTIARCPPGCMASCTNNIVRFVSLMHWWLSFLGCGSFSGCYASLHCSYSNAAYSFLQNGLVLLWRSDYVWREC